MNSSSTLTMTNDDLLHIPRWPAGSVLPDYGEGGLLGLMRNIGHYLDGHPWRLPGQQAERQPKVLVFLLVDGLGDNFLQREGAGSTLAAHRYGRLTSVFPSTTAAAVTTTFTALAPVQHGLNGWFVHERRLGGIIAPLPLTLRAGGAVMAMRAAPRLFPYHTLFQRRRRPAVVVTPQWLSDSRYTRWHTRGASVIGYTGLDELVNMLCAVVWGESGAAGRGGLVHAYFPDFDALSHRDGCTSPAARDCFAQIDAAFQTLLERCAGCDVEFVVTADHGFLDSPPEQHCWLDERPDLVARLVAPLFGERRTAFCAVRQGEEARFAADLQDWLGPRGVVRSTADADVQALFGPGRAHRHWRERLGTHAVFMAPGWTLRDSVADEIQHEMLGVHGGLSGDEMWIPLIHARRVTQGGGFVCG